MAAQDETPDDDTPNRDTPNYDTPDDAALKARLQALSAALDVRQAGDAAEGAKTSAQEQGGQARGRAMNVAARVLSEFVAGIVVGGFIGWELDAFFGSKPWLFIVFLLLGTITGFYNVIRISQSENRAQTAALRSSATPSGDQTRVEVPPKS